MAFCIRCLQCMCWIYLCGLSVLGMYIYIYKHVRACLCVCMDDFMRAWTAAAGNDRVSLREVISIPRQSRYPVVVFQLCVRRKIGNIASLDMYKPIVSSIFSFFIFPFSIFSFGMLIIVFFFFFCLRGTLLFLRIDRKKEKKLKEKFKMSTYGIIEIIIFQK